MTMTNPRGTRAYQRAVKALKAQGDQPCWRCGTWLSADAHWPHPLTITLGHLTALEDGGSLLDPHNHRAECIKCNMGDGARRTNNKRRGDTGTSYVNPNW